jgi:Cof subfamily protein (haloacid dehalogenase superfamily)
MIKNTVENNLMIITDLDNSLLNDDRKISKYTKSVFKKCKELGLIIVFATARPYRKTLVLFDSIKPDAVICHCGGTIYINDKMISQNGIKSTVAKNIIKNIVNDYSNVNIGIESNDEIFTNFDTSIYWKDVPYKNIDLKNMPSEIIDKIIIGLELIGTTKKLEKYLSNDLYIEKMDEKIGLVMNKNASKWNGIIKLLEYYNVKRENTISFGDDDVDIEMIEKCGVGVAVENGNERIKNKAKYICENNNEDGIAKWIEANILKKGQTCT